TLKYAGVIDQNIESRQVFDCLLDAMLNGARVRNVELQRKSLPSQGVDFCRDFFGVVLMEIGYCDPRTGSCELNGNTSTDTPGAAGDEGAPRMHITWKGSSHFGGNQESAYRDGPNRQIRYSRRVRALPVLQPDAGRGFN